MTSNMQEQLTIDELITSNNDPRQGWTSASNAEADSLCQGRHQAQKGIPELPPSDDAAFGQVIHDALAKRDPSGLDSQQLDIYESCVRIEERVVAQVFGNQKPHTAAHVRMWTNIPVLSDANIILRHSGEADRLYWLNGIGLIIDTKTLAGDVPSAPNNKQLRDLTVLFARDKLLIEVYTAIIQPLVTHSPSLAHYTINHISIAAREMTERVLASNTHTAVRTAGEVQCKFCRAKTACKEYAAWTAPALPSTSSLPSKPWTKEQWLQFMEVAPEAKRWIEAKLSEAKRLLKSDPTAIPGYELKSLGTETKVTDPSAFIARMEALGIPRDECESAMEPIKGRVEPLVRKHCELKGKALKEKVNGLYDGITEQTPWSPSLVKVEEA